MRIAVVGQDVTGVGGVPTVARWLTSQIEAEAGFEYELVDLATSAVDPYSRRITVPRTWFRRSLRAEERRDGSTRWGANLVELEVARYMPRRELTAHLAGFDLIQVVAGTPSIAWACLRAGPPVVLQVATLASWERMKPTSTLRRFIKLWNEPLIAVLERRAVRSVAALLVENQKLAAHVRELGQPNIHIAPPGVDCDRFSPPDRPERRGPLLSVCRLGDERKGLHRMVQSYARLVERRGAAVPDLVLAGAGPAPSSLLDAIESLSLSARVTVREDVAADELPALYRSASCFVQTSYEEGLGISSIEAMATGLPVVSSATAGSSEVVADGVTGRLVHDGPSFEEDFALALEQVIFEPDDHLYANARSRAVDRFSDSATFATFREVYAGALR